MDAPPTSIVCPWLLYLNAAGIGAMAQFTRLRGICADTCEGRNGATQGVSHGLESAWGIEALGRFCQAVIPQRRGVNNLSILLQRAVRP